jgi:branched-chain amino acid transport system ATP-binding protein
MLELVAIDAGYGSFQALLGVSLEIRPGEAVAVIGPNNAGKETWYLIAFARLTAAPAAA